MRHHCPYKNCKKYVLNEMFLSGHIAHNHLPMERFPEVSVYEIAYNVIEASRKAGII